jgi:outer membrane protein
MVFGPPLIWSFGPRARIVDDTYTAAYFGVTSAQSPASGLPVYSAAGGLYSYGIGGTAILPLDRDNRWSAVLFASYERLTGDAASSPLVQLRGSEDQATLGLFVSYRAF